MNKKKLDRGVWKHYFYKGDKLLIELSFQPYNRTWSSLMYINGNKQPYCCELLTCWHEKLSDTLDFAKSVYDDLLKKVKKNKGVRK
jgi:hypothetical protein